MSKAYESLVELIETAAEEGVTIEVAERTAGAALLVMETLSSQLTFLDRETRMRKRGLKAIKSAVRLAETKKYDKKPTEGALDDAVNLDETVQKEEAAFDDSEVMTQEVERQFGIAKETHLYFRGLSKGAYSG